MAEVAKKPVSDTPQRRIRMTLTSTNVKALEKVTSEFLSRAKKRELKSYGPIRMPTKTLRITTRKTPCGEGSKTWSRYQLRIHKRVLDIISTTETVRDMTHVAIDPAVSVEITVDDAMKSMMKPDQQQQQQQPQQQQLQTA